MKIWRNKNRTKFLRLTSVDYWEYLSKEIAEQVLNRGINYSILELKVNGASISFYGPEADEVYKILQSQKEVL